MPASWTARSPSRRTPTSWSRRSTSTSPRSLGHPLRAINLPASADALTVERALADIRAADWVFAGPGSPSYARRCWEATGVPEALAGVVAPGRSGSLVFASAAVVTLGEWALPVYEIYKVGEDPRWEPGIGLMSQILGWRCAVIPHYDNREGGTHDTRFCYVGGRRLAQIEPDLGDGFILGVDEHTALVLDLDAGTAWVAGRSAVTLRVAGVEDVVPNGARVTIAELEDRIAALGAGSAVGRGTGASGEGARGNADASLDVARHGPLAGSGADAASEADARPGHGRSRRPRRSRPRRAPSSRPSRTPRPTSVPPWWRSSTRPSPPPQRTTASWRAGPCRRWWTCARTAARPGDWAASDRLRDVLADGGRGGARQPRGVDMAVDVTPGPIALVGSGSTCRSCSRSSGT